MSKLFDAVAGGNLDEVKQLVAKGADVNTVDQLDNTALHWAAVNGHAAVVEFRACQEFRVRAGIMGTKEISHGPTQTADDTRCPA